MSHGGYEVSQVREMAIEAQAYLNDARDPTDAAKRGLEIVDLLDNAADYNNEYVALYGLYKRAYLLKDGSSKKFLDDSPIYGISDGFMVSDFGFVAKDLPDTPRQRDLLAKMEEFTDGPYAVFHRLKTGGGQQIGDDGLVVRDISVYAAAPIGSAAVFPNRIEPVDELLAEEHLEEAERVIASAGPFFKDMMERIEYDLKNVDVIEGLIFAARKFRGICEAGDKIVRSAALTRLSALTVEHLRGKTILASENIPLSLMIKDDVLTPVSFIKKSVRLCTGSPRNGLALPSTGTWGATTVRRSSRTLFIGEDYWYGWLNSALALGAHEGD